MVPNLYTRTFDADELVLLTRLLELAHDGLVEADYPPSVLIRSAELRIRVIGDEFPVEHA